MIISFLKSYNNKIRVYHSDSQLVSHLFNLNGNRNIKIEISHFVVEHYRRFPLFFLMELRDVPVQARKKCLHVTTVIFKVIQ